MWMIMFNRLSHIYHIKLSVMIPENISLVNNYIKYAFLKTKSNVKEKESLVLAQGYKDVPKYQSTDNTKIGIKGILLYIKKKISMSIEMS